MYLAWEKLYSHAHYNLEKYGTWHTTTDSGKLSHLKLSLFFKTKYFTAQLLPLVLVRITESKYLKGVA